jgi:hypothetical protein
VNWNGVEWSGVDRGRVEWSGIEWSRVVWCGVVWRMCDALRHRTSYETPPCQQVK